MSRDKSSRIVLPALAANSSPPESQSFASRYLAIGVYNAIPSMVSASPYSQLLTISHQNLRLGIFAFHTDRVLNLWLLQASSNPGHVAAGQNINNNDASPEELDYDVDGSFLLANDATGLEDWIEAGWTEGLDLFLPDLGDGDDDSGLAGDWGSPSLAFVSVAERHAAANRIIELDDEAACSKLINPETDQVGQPNCGAEDPRAVLGLVSPPSLDTIHTRTAEQTSPLRPSPQTTSSTSGEFGWVHITPASTSNGSPSNRLISSRVTPEGEVAVLPDPRVFLGPCSKIWEVPKVKLCSPLPHFGGDHNLSAF